MYNSATMRALFLDVPEAVLEERRRTGIDRWDEMWDGVLHMAPAPLYEHQRVLNELQVFLTLAVRDGRGIVVPQVNVFGASTPELNYRIPDLTFVSAGREQVIARDGIRGGPDAVVEVRSPGDESYDKLPFFASLRVREVIIIDRDTKVPEVFRLEDSRYAQVPAGDDGWIESFVLGVRFRPTAADPPRLVVEDLSRPSHRAEI